MKKPHHPDMKKSRSLTRRQFLKQAGAATTAIGASQALGGNTNAATAGPQHQVACRTGVQWTNWSGNVSSRPECAFYPETRDDLIAIVNQARQAGKKIRIAGDSHSFSPLVPTDEHMMLIRQLNNVTADTSDPNNPLVTMECGANVFEVDNECRRHGIALPANVVLKTVLYGGLIATGCHGSGWNNVTLSDLVQSIDIIDSSGQLRTYTEASVGADVMNAARLNLGLFGVIHKMTLRAVPMFNARNIDNVRANMAETLANIKEIVTSHDYVDLFWWPFNDFLWLKIYDRTDEPVTQRPSRQIWDAIIDFFQTSAGRTAYNYLSSHPEQTPAFSKLLFRTLPNRDVVEPIDRAIHYQDFINLLKVANTEFAFTIDPEFNNVQRAWQIVLDKTNEYAAQGKYPFNLTLNARFIKNSQTLLSPATGNEHTCFIEILSFYNTPGWQEFSADVSLEWMKLPNAKPHWPKEFQQIPGIIPFIRQAYGENFNTFLRLRDELGVDPNRMFVNPYLERVFFSPA
jgi:hypothetical protein